MGAEPAVLPHPGAQRDASAAGPADPPALATLRGWFQAGQLERVQAALAEAPPSWRAADPARLGLWLIVQATTVHWHDDVDAARTAARDAALHAVPVDRLDSQTRSEVALARIMLGALDEAETLLQSAVAMPDASPWAWFRLGTLAGIRRDWDAARSGLERGLALMPERAEAWDNLAKVLQHLDEPDAALQAFKKAWALRPAMRAIAVNAIAALERAGDTALEAHAQQLRAAFAASDPQDVVARAGNRVQLALIAEHRGELPEALALIGEAVQLHEDHEETRRVFIELMMREQRYGPLGRKLLLWSSAYDVYFEHLALAQCRIEAGFLDAAATGLDAIKHRAHGDPAWDMAWARVLQERSDARAACDILEAVHQRHPQHVLLNNQLADVLASLGEMERATALTQQVAEHNPGALIRLVESKKAPTEEDVQRLTAWKNRTTAAEASAAVGFALAKVHDVRKEYAAAAEALRAANDALWPRLGFDAAAFSRTIDFLIAQHDAGWLAAHQSGRAHTVRPVFIVGMPRSGTTLLEQIFAAHPEVYGGGELPYMARIRSLSERLTQKVYPHAVTALSAKQVGDAADYYLQLAERSLGFTESVLVDKLPHNFMHAALLCAMFPDARIIALRRDYRAIALSNYFQNFAAARGLLGYAFDLEALGQHLKDFHRLMDFWKRTLPADRYREFHYEELVQNPTDTIPEVLTFCGLDFTPEVMEFYRNQTTVRTASIRQVRNPLYTGSVEKWRHYADLLAPVIRIVEEDA